MSTLLVFILYCVLTAITISLIERQIELRARFSGVDSAWYLARGRLFGIILSAVAPFVTYWALRSQMPIEPLPGIGATVFILIAIFGAVVGTGSCYLYLRMQTARDPDYEETELRPEQSDVADVPQPRDRDHLGPE